MLYLLCFYWFVRESIRQLTVNCWNTVFMLEFRQHCRYEPHITKSSAYTQDSCCGCFIVFTQMSPAY